ncbi:MAG: alpha/beta fold hydrolase [Bacteroidales bacterium]|nr:alpha/beta fold hydrolase [Bacteroidales bacterium]
MIFLWITLAIVFLFVLFFWLMVNSFKIVREKPEQMPTEYGIGFEEVRYETNDGNRLYGWWIAGKPASPTLILVHGWGKSVGRLMPYIKNLHGKGFNILAFDARNHGNSDGNRFSSLLTFAEDISAGIRFVSEQKENKNCDIFLLGMSIGGAASVYAAARDPRIKKVITMGAPTNPAEVMAYQLKKKHIPYYPFIWLLFQAIQLKIGIRFSKLATVNNIGKSEAEFLIIHGEIDKVVPVDHGRRILERARSGRAELWVVPGGGHSNCHYKPGFWEKMTGFLNERNA